MYRRLCSAALATLLVVPATGQAASEPDYAREKRLAEQTVDAIFDGEPIELTDAATGRDFLAVFMEAQTDETRGTVIIMHGRGTHPDWEDTVAPLRVGLTEHGWNTLSIQMPVLEKDARYYDYVPIFPASFGRIEAAIRHARAAGPGPVVLFAHSCSVHMSMAYVEQHGDQGFDAYIGAGMGATDYKQPMRKPFPLSSMSVPVLDIYGAEEFPAVKKGAPARLAALRGRHPSSAQRVVAGADHYFKGAGEALTAEVASWLDSVDWSARAAR